MQYVMATNLSGGFATDMRVKMAAAEFNADVNFLFESSKPLNVDWKRASPTFPDP